MNPMQRFRLFAIAGLVVLASACTTNDPLPQEVDDRVRLTKMTTTYRDEAYLVRFFYNADGNVDSVSRREISLNQPTRHGRVACTKYEYDANKRAIREVLSDSLGASSLIGVYTYDANSSLVRVNYESPSWGGSIIYHHYEFSYVSGRVAEFSYVFSSGAQYRKAHYTYDRFGNISKIETSNENQPTKFLYYADISYNNRRNYLSAVKGLTNPWALFAEGPSIFSKSNPISYTKNGFGSTKKITCSYLYNGYGYPVRQTFNDGTVVDFEYNK